MNLAIETFVLTAVLRRFITKALLKDLIWMNLINLQKILKQWSFSILFSDRLVDFYKNMSACDLRNFCENINHDLL